MKDQRTHRSHSPACRCLILLAVLAAGPLLGQRSDPPTNATRPGRGARVQGRIVPGPGGSQVPEVMVIKLYQVSGPLLETGLVRNGLFLFPNIANGVYRLRLEAEGFQTVEQDFTLQNVTPGQMEFVHMTLGAPATAGDTVNQGATTLDTTLLSLPEEAAAELEEAAKASKKKRYQKAVEHIRKAIEICPDYYPAYNNLGVQFLRLERYAEADQAFRKSLELHPSAPAYLNLGKLLLYQQQLEPALNLLEKAYQLDSRDDLTIRSLGEAYFRNGRYEEALRHFQDLSNRDKDPTLNIGKANCFLRLERFEEARQEFKAFLKKEPRGRRADYIRSQLRNISP